MNSDCCSRIFVVGCARSGTTLLQTMLCAHNNIVSFPESQFFADLIDQYESRVMGAKVSYRHMILYILQSMLLYIGLTPRPDSGVCAINRFIDKTNIHNKRYQPGIKKYLLSSQISEMIRLMDRAAGLESKSTWLFKTPANLSYIDVIQKYVEGAKFIHILRPGRDVVASIYDAAMKHPDTVWQTHFYRGSLERIAIMWNQAIRQSIKYSRQKNHTVVLYENLVANPKKELSKIFEFMGLEDDPTCSERYTEEAGNVITENEKWKSGVSRKVSRTDKYESLFDDRQKAIIESVLNNIDIANIANS